MAFRDIFKDENDINEKSVIGFISFTIMVLYAATSVIGSLMGYAIPINETIYGSFVTVTIGAFGIAEAGRAISSFSSSRRGSHSYYNERPRYDMEQRENEPFAPLEETEDGYDDYKDVE